MARYVAAVYVGQEASLGIVGDDGRMVHLELERVNRIRHTRGTVDGLYWLALDLLGVRDSAVEAVCSISDSLGCTPPTWFDMNDIEVRGVASGIVAPGRPVYTVPHHTAHLAYALYTSPFERARLVAQDGGGDGFTPEFLWHMSMDATIGWGRHPFGQRASELDHRSFNAQWIAPQMIGGAWLEASRQLFDAPFQEGKVMALVGLAPETFSQRTGFPSDVHVRVRRLQGWINRVFDQVVPRIPGDDGVALAGGSALNGIAVYHLLQRQDVVAVHVPPAVHDGGIPIGAAMVVLYQKLDCPRVLYPRDTVAFCGYTEPALEGDPPIDRIVEALAASQVVAIAYGRAESGPRALGHRSILACPDALAMKDKLNRIKGREPWRPVAPCVLRSYADTYFRLLNDTCYDYMTTIAAVRPEAWTDIPAAVHDDGTARVQVVDEDDMPLGRILSQYYQRTGLPVLLNTSLNGRGEPIANTAAEAKEFFDRSPELDAIAIGSEWHERT